jgi:bifunctional ADP-heptose synthase (sugar kinase/adenylyltransferase)
VELIRQLRPDLLVRGADGGLPAFAGLELVQEWGGAVRDAGAEA